jgi:lambda repressor-like predicted transcriptional regulator
MRAMPKRNYDPAMVRALLAERERNRWSLGEISRRSGVPVGTLSSWAAKAMRSRQADADAQCNCSATGTWTSRRGPLRTAG